MSVHTIISSTISFKTFYYWRLFLVTLACHIYIYIYIYDSQIVPHNPCFNCFILHNNSLNNQGSEINKNVILTKEFTIH